MTNFADLVDSRNDARKKLVLAVKNMGKNESLQRRILFWGTLFVIAAMCVATVFSHPSISKIGGFICSIAVLLIYCLFGLFQLVINGELRKTRKDLDEAEAKEKDATQASFVHIATYDA